ncbi:MAG: HAD family hydrolase [Muribaculaceae bacterium]|jgi:putative hydrolase of the HAD superfamily|nr:HAD family hydrolase [Muribaculaceae bacterium]
MSEFAGLKGIIFDYGGTIDSRGTHWSEVIWDAYVACGVKVDKAVFRDAYVHAERELARVRHILPQDDFYTLLLKKMRIELAWLIEGGHITCDQPEELAQALAHYCDDRARECIAEARPVLEALAERFPLMLVSNFYGNVDTVLHTYDVRRYFKGVIESAVVGVRKPNPTIFRLGIDALELPAEQVLVVGDSLRKDIFPAESLGCHTVWLKGKGWTADEDAQTHPHTITRIAQLLPMLQ